MVFPTHAIIIFFPILKELYKFCLFHINQHEFLHKSFKKLKESFPEHKTYMSTPTTNPKQLESTSTRRATASVTWR